LFGTSSTSDPPINISTGNLDGHVLITGLPDLTAKVISTPQFSGRTLPFGAHRERIMKWSARGVAAPTYDGPLQLNIREFPVPEAA
jgi:hypothetical protein